MLSIIGAVNIDIVATVLNEYHPQDSNPAKVILSVGGVAMNYAHNLRLLGEEIQFFTAFSNDNLGQMVQQQCNRLSIDISSALCTEQARANIFMGIHNSDGELESAACDAELTEYYVNEEYLAQRIDVINRSSLVMADANLSVSALAYLFDHVQAPLMIDGVSIAKIERIVQALQKCAHPHVHTLKLNVKEYEVFQQSLQRLDLVNVIECLLVTKGSLGVDYYQFIDSPTHQFPISFPALSAMQIVSTLGAGDAFLSGWAWAYLHHYPLERAIECAQMLAIHTLAVPDAVNTSQIPTIFSLYC